MYVKRIVLDQMIDPHPVSQGTQGTIQSIDDMNQIHVKWDNGSTLALNPDVDSYHLISTEDEIKASIEHFDKYTFCPRCGGVQGKALSRRVNVTICNQCGALEAIEDAFNIPSSIKEWYVVKEIFKI